MSRQSGASDGEVLRDLCYALFRSNIDWAEASQACGDPECAGDCRFIATIRHIVREVDGGVLPEPAPRTMANLHEWGFTDLPEEPS